MLTTSLLELKKYETINPARENDMLNATSVIRMKNTFTGLNFDIKMKARNVGR
jgi:hypothetical protein